MKIRSKFISNSSSSSFIIGFLEEEERCPTCGRGENLEEELERASRMDCDTSLCNDNIDSIIEDCKEGISNSNFTIDVIKRAKKPTIKHYGEDWKRQIKDEQGFIEQCEYKIKNIENIISKSKRTIMCNISYHDSHIKEMLDSLERRKKIIKYNLYGD